MMEDKEKQMPVDIKTIRSWPVFKEVLRLIPFDDEEGFPDMLRRLGKNCTPEVLEQLVKALEVTPEIERYLYAYYTFPAMVEKLGENCTPEVLECFVKALGLVPEKHAGSYTLISFPTMVEQLAKNCTPEVLEHFVKALKLIPEEYRSNYTEVSFLTLVEELGKDCTPEVLGQFVKALEVIPDEGRYTYTWQAFPTMVQKLGKNCTPDVLKQYANVLRLVPEDYPFNFTMFYFPAMVEELGENCTPEVLELYVKALKLIPEEHRSNYTKVSFPTMAEKLGKNCTPEVLEQYIEALAFIPEDYRHIYTQHTLPAMIDALGEKFDAACIVPLAQSFAKVLVHIPGEDCLNYAENGFPTVVRELGKNCTPEVLEQFVKILALIPEGDRYGFAISVFPYMLKALGENRTPELLEQSAKTLALLPKEDRYGYAAFYSPARRSMFGKNCTPEVLGRINDALEMQNEKQRFDWIKNVLTTHVEAMDPGQSDFIEFYMFESHGSGWVKQMESSAVSKTLWILNRPNPPLISLNAVRLQLEALLKPPLPQKLLRGVASLVSEVLGKGAKEQDPKTVILDGMMAGVRTALEGMSAESEGLEAYCPQSNDGDRITIITPHHGTTLEAQAAYADYHYHPRTILRALVAASKVVAANKELSSVSRNHARQLPFTLIMQMNAPRVLRGHADVLAELDLGEAVTPTQVKILRRQAADSLNPQGFEFSGNIAWPHYPEPPEMDAVIVMQDLFQQLQRGMSPEKMNTAIKELGGLLQPDERQWLPVDADHLHSLYHEPLPQVGILRLGDITDQGITIQANKVIALYEKLKLKPGDDLQGELHDAKEIMEVFHAPSSLAPTAFVRNGRQGQQTLRLD